MQIAFVTHVKLDKSGRKTLTYASTSASTTLLREKVEK
jgi:hypothetical protein